MKALSVFFSCIFCCIKLTACQINLLNVAITYTNSGSQTNFVVKTNFGSVFDLNNVWLGIGFNSGNEMPGASVVVCKNLKGSIAVQHYYNNGYNSNLMNSANPTIGLSKTSVNINQGTFTCTFTRDNSNPDSRYFNLNNKSPFILVAYNQGDVGFHMSYKRSSASVVQFPAVASVTPRITSVSNSGNITNTKISISVAPLTSTISSSSFKIQVSTQMNLFVMAIVVISIFIK